MYINQHVCGIRIVYVKYVETYRYFLCINEMDITNNNTMSCRYIIILLSISFSITCADINCVMRSIMYADIGSELCLVCPSSNPVKHYWRHKYIVSAHTYVSYIWHNGNILPVYSNECDIRYVPSLNAYALVFYRLSIRDVGLYECSNDASYTSVPANGTYVAYT